MRWKEACDITHKTMSRSIAKEMFCYGGKDKSLKNRLCKEARIMVRKTKEEATL